MKISTRHVRWGLLLAVAIVYFTQPSYGQRQVTLNLNSATLPDTTLPTSLMEVRGAVNSVAPITLADGNIIDWSDASTLEPENVGGDYWRIVFEIADTTDLTFKFFSQQAQDIDLDGWEADPNPNIPPGVADTTLPLHYFEFSGEWRGLEAGSKGDYTWRPFEEKEDSIGVWFRVYMASPEGETDGYDPSLDAPDQQIGVRGDNLNGTGPVDWGSTNLVLERESETINTPGFDLYSGVAYYPESAVNSVQNYKFVLEDAVLNDATIGWEEGNLTSDRSFTVPAQDTTLHWVYYGNTVPSPAQPVTSNIIFTVDLSPFETIGIFDRARGDTLEVRGGFNGWDCAGEGAPDDCLMQRIAGEDQFELAAAVTRFPGVNVDYKYYLNFNDETFAEQFGVSPPQGWEEGHRTGIDRNFTFTGEPVVDLGVEFYNDVTPANVILGGNSIDVHFAVDMSSAVDNTVRPFDPSADSVFLEIGDPMWALTQGLTEGEFPTTEGFLKDPDGDLVYEGVLTVEGPTYSNLTFKYGYGAGNDLFIEEGGDTKPPPGRRRTRFILPNDDGSWPSAFTLPTDSFQATGELPWEANPALSTGIEVVDRELPSTISLDQNYPNPFNPATRIQFTLDQTQDVRVRVFDLMGRVVATLVDGVQTAGTYSVTFDGANLASGMYVYRLETPNRTLSKKMVLLK